MKPELIPVQGRVNREQADGTGKAPRVPIGYACPFPRSSRLPPEVIGWGPWGTGTESPKALFFAARAMRLVFLSAR